MLKPLRWLPIWMSLGVCGIGFVVYQLLLPQPDFVTSSLLNDKAMHFIAFGGVTAWFAGLLKRHAWPVLAIVMTGLGLATEVAQGAMALGRVADGRDFFADIAGIAFALLLASVGTEHWAMRFEGWFEQNR
ncbi:MAG: hypothetical protein AAF265_03865 [Pseudomonadota bacterium]